MNKRLLITGANGMLGSNLVKRYQDNYLVFSTGKSEFGLSFFDNYMSFDLQKGAYNDLIEWSKPDVVIHCAALTDGNYCKENALEAFDVNGVSLEKLTRVLNHNVRIIYISTDAVFPSTTHMAKESQCVGPQSVYGKSKELGEHFLKNSESNYTIVRTTIVGFNQNLNKKGFTEWIIDSATSRREISLFDDVMFTPISCFDLAVELEFLFGKDSKFLKDTVHVCGSESITKYEFGIALLNSINMKKDLIKRGSILSLVDRAKRSTDQSMSVADYEQKAKRKLPNLKNTIATLKNEYCELS